MRGVYTHPEIQNNYLFIYDNEGKSCRWETTLTPNRTGITWNIHYLGYDKTQLKKIYNLDKDYNIRPIICNYPKKEIV